MHISRSSNLPLILALAVATVGLTACESDRYGFAETRGFVFKKPAFVDVKVPTPAKPDAQSWYNQGFEYQVKRKWPEAIACYNKACELDPHNKGFWNGLGNANQFADRMESARIAFLRAHELDVFDSSTMTAIGFVDTRQGKHDEESARFYLMALAINPGLKEAWDNLVAVLHRMDEDDLLPPVQKMAAAPTDNSSHVADMINDRYLSKFPDDAEAYITKGILNTRFLNVQVAKAAFDKALELKKDSPRALIAYGLLYDAMGDQKKALEYFTRCTELSPSQPMAWIGRGQIEYRLKNYVEAENSYSKGSLLAPENALWSAKVGEIGKLIELQKQKPNQ